MFPCFISEQKSIKLSFNIGCSLLSGNVIGDFEFNRIQSCFLFGSGQLRVFFFFFIPFFFLLHILNLGLKQNDNAYSGLPHTDMM